MSIRFQRLLIIILSLIFISLAITLILVNSKNNIIFFFTPTELINHSTKSNDKVRVGGFVLKDSLKKNSETNIYSFVITDNKNNIAIEFEGILPDLFKEEKGAVIEGMLNNNRIIAKRVFAKHDENYMPASIKKQLKKSNYWKRNY